MSDRVVFCPQAPAIVSTVGRGLDAELGGLREMCRCAIAAAADGADRVVLLGSAECTARFAAGATGSFAPFGVPVEVALGTSSPTSPPVLPPVLPPSLTVGAWLLHDAIGARPDAQARAVAAGDAPTDLFDSEVTTALVVLGDGTARRGEKAPGYLDPRAEGRDDEFAAALGAGDPDGLRARDPLDAQLLVAGSAAWDATARATSGRGWDGELSYAGAPFGVGYVVASWRAR